MKVSTTRRKVLKGIGAAIAAPAILRHTRAYADNPTIKVGFVSPKTGPLAGFAEADDFVLKGVQAALSGGVENNGKNIPERKNGQNNHSHRAE